MPTVNDSRDTSAAQLGTDSAPPISGEAIRPSAGSDSKTTRQVWIEARPEAIAIDLNRTTVLVIDMQNDFGSKGGMFDRAGIDISGIHAVVPNVQRTLVAARMASLPIIYIKMAFKADLSDAGPPTGPNLLKHAPMQVGKLGKTPDGSPTRTLIRDNWGTEIIPELQPASGDVELYKSRFSGFYQTELDDILKQHGLETLIVTGCTTSVCVDSTVRDAMFRDYRCLVLEDCSAEPIAASASRSNHEASILTMQMLFAWISDSKKLDTALASPG